TGVYLREEVVNLIREYRLDVMVIASPWPETYSYTLSEAWLAGTPVIVGPLGAPAERVSQTGAGLIAPDYRPESYVHLLRKLAQDPLELQRLRSVVAEIDIESTFDTQRQLYSSLTSGMPAGTALFGGAPYRDLQAAPVTQAADAPPIIVKLV